ncbi:hypothetical protein GYMLUDRAFT_83893 [Collybiopsis luxurians FD-317 M1]|uniref:F-box domain-containing protein n=1 Tax=Collybiopsis luxurians FD-317 M1 TaxID=944289 RepID=A0A0D0CUX5_9AGAR|nr:hypothetical protein GYMLUDRAFT_83893 [Collybiopsis luxurians FD-317 M1]
MRSEYGPLSIQSDEIYNLLENLYQDLKDVESSGMDGDSHRSCILEYTNQVQSLLAPVRNVPNEVLERIFNECCDINHFVVSKPSSEAVSVIRTKPTMNWDVAKDMDGYDESQLENLSFPLTTFLSRSLDHALTIKLVLNATPKLKDGSIHPSLAQLTQHSHRWQSLSFDSDDFDLRRHCFPDQKLPAFSLLEDLELIDDMQTVHNFHYDQPLPKLKTLRTTVLYPSPFKQILHLEVHEHLEGGIPALFAAIPNLLSLALVGDCQLDYRYPDSLCLVPPSMQSLTLRFCKGYKYHPSPSYSIFPYSIFPYLDASYLKALYLELVSDHSQDNGY